MVADSSAVQPKTKMTGAATSISSVNGATAGACSSDRSVASSLRPGEIPGNMRNHELLRVEKDSASCHYSCRPPRPSKEALSALTFHLAQKSLLPSRNGKRETGYHPAKHAALRRNNLSSSTQYPLGPRIIFKLQHDPSHQIRKTIPLLLRCPSNAMPAFSLINDQKRCRSNSIVNPNRKLCPCPGRRT